MKQISGTIHNERGFTLIEGLIAMILLAIAAALIFGAWNTTQVVHAKNCENTVLTIQQWERQWEQSKASGNPDVNICTEMNKIITDYNGRCGKDFGNLSKVSCG